MAIFRGEGGAGDADNDVTVTTVTEKATEAANSATAAAASATQSANSASAAATSATNAATSETNAGTSETNAATSATNAATSETNASTSETNAATSATNAATSATNAAASYDDFDDRYLGAKASDPSTDNDGDALITGALYFNTVSNNMQVYNGTAWTVLTGTGAAETNDLTAAVVWANVPDANITESSVTQHEAALSITESQVSDLQSYLTTVAINDVSDVTITTPADNEVLAYDNTSSKWINQTASEAGLLTGNETITLSGDVSGSGTTAITVTVADDSHNHIISNVDGLQTALDAKGTLSNVVEDTTPQLGGTLDANSNTIDMGTNIISDTKVGQWDTAYGWGDHSTQGYLTSFTETNDLTAAVTWANVPDANITQSSVTQHQAALSITESQISDLDHYADADVDTHLNTSTATSSQVLSWTGTDYDWVDAASGSDLVNDTTPQLGGDLDLNSSDITGTGNVNITGDVDASGDVVGGTVVAGEGSGGIALTVNDGGGNANVCFNHRSQTPEQDGNAGRIDVNTDSTSSCHMTFGLAENVTSGVVTSATDVMELYENGEWYIDAGFGSLGQAFAVRAWVNMTPNTTINGSGNVSSVSRSGTGQYRVNFTNAMPDANYAVAIMGNDGANRVTFRTSNINTTFVIVEFKDSGGSLEDISTRVTVAVIR